MNFDRYASWDKALVIESIPVHPRECLEAVNVLFKWRDVYTEKKMRREWEENEIKKSNLREHNPGEYPEENFESFRTRYTGDITHVCALTGETIPKGQEMFIPTFNSKHPLYGTVLTYRENVRNAYKMSKEFPKSRKRRLGNVEGCDTCFCCQSDAVYTFHSCKKHKPSSAQD